MVPRFATLGRIPKGVWVLGGVSLLMDVSSEMIHSLLPLFMATTLGASVIIIGLIEGLAEATALILKVFSGVISDYVGKRKGLALLGYGLGALSKPLFAIAPTAGVVFSARMIDRVGKGIRAAPRDALVADVTPPEIRGAAYGLRQALDTVGAFLGPLLAVLLMFIWANDFHAIFWVAVIPAVLSILLLGFGLQEIFANFISGLIILFEKPIRIGDTVTIRDLTGSVTRINTRATTISDWDRKEIIVPNKAFITEQFINWSLSDSVTRVVLTVPAPVDADTDEVTKILIAAAHRCSLVIDTPAPEAFLVDLQQGIQIFELRIFAAEMGHRMPLRHEMHQLILAGFREHGIDMPFPPFQMRLESIDGRQSSKTMTSAGKTSRRTAGSL